MDPQLYFDPKAGNSLLHRIVSQGEEATALNLLNQGADYTIQNSVGQTPLHTAFYNNMFEVVERILAEYKNFENNPIDSNGLSYLHIASSVYGRVGSASVQHLIEIGADVNQCVSHDSQFYPGYTALHFAAEWGRSHNARALLKNGAKYSLQNNLNETAFDLALSRAQFDQEPSSYDVMREIVLQDMQSNDLNFINYGFTPLHLLEHDATSKYINTICAKYNFDVNGKVSKTGAHFHLYTPLHFAAEFGLTDVVPVLIELGANMFDTGADGTTPLHLGVGFSSIMPAFSTYMSLGVRPTVLDNVCNEDGFSFLHIATAYGNYQWTKDLINNGADANTPVGSCEGHEHGETPLHLVIEHNLNQVYPIVKHLLENGASVSKVNEMGNTPLHCATVHHDPKIIQILIEYGSDVKALNYDLQTPMYSILKNSSYSGENVQFAESNFKTLLSVGAGISSIVRKDECLLCLGIFEQDRYDMVTCMISYIKNVIKMQVIGLLEIEPDIAAVQTYCEQPNFNAVEFRKQCVDEVEQLSKTYWTTCSIKDLILRSHHDMVGIIGDDDMVGIVEDDEPKEKECNSLWKTFPIYEQVIQFKIKKLLKRAPLVTECHELLHHLLEHELPCLCIKKILSFLSDEDLNSMVFSHIVCQSRWITLN
ncbi:hypothetical protein QAD02_021387 [Eretmocerus hayati]|uniref:Uncharacterized protein n=1 Tax=Eretmocerus hayati TaxID=131215 RepID=A0ACC2PSL7_9HYME|nr:hypothetical protein QAD02_021387 [Eretmocerus hayati]